MRQTFKVKDIQPNPFRNMKQYPIKRQKVDALKESIKRTTFWDNIVARVVNGKPQIAYGHHRLVALQEALPKNTEVGLIVRDLSDGDMLKIMARENMEEWRADLSVRWETIRAVVQAYADGKIVLPTPPKDTRLDQIRYAPSFALGRAGESPARPYTVRSLRAFVGWKEDDITRRLRELEAMELGLVKEKDLLGDGKNNPALTIAEVESTVAVALRHYRDAQGLEAEGKTKQATAVREFATKSATRAVEDHRAARRHEGTKAKERTKEAARSVVQEQRRKRITSLHEVADKLIRHIRNTLSDGDPAIGLVKVVLGEAEDVSNAQKAELVEQLNELAMRAQVLASEIDSLRGESQVALLK